MKNSNILKANFYWFHNCFIFLILFISLNTYGQVGINTTNPNAVLDIRSSNQATPSSIDGILIPKADNFPTVNPTINQDGMLIFITGNSIPSRGFYYWDNTSTSWVLIAGVSSGGNTLDQAYDQGGVGLGKNINATNGAVRINGTDGFLVTGTIGTGDSVDTEASGAGTRMFFNPYKSAFRAGTIFDFSPIPSDQWDDGNIGYGSTAFGINTLASGGYSTAFGSFTTASANTSTAFGSFTTASGIQSTAFGTETSALGDHSTTFGYDTTASATTSTAFGSFTIASGNYSTTYGNSSSASGVTATAFGAQTNASGDTSTAFGSLTVASGNISTAFGLQTDASGQISTAFGSSTTASGNTSTAFGGFTLASGSGSTAFGIGTIAPSSYETAIGMYNTTYLPVVSGPGFNLQDRLFVVGNGVDSANRSNALTIYKSGLISLNDTVGIGTDLPTANLSVNGIANKLGGGAWAVFSDERLKENISDYSQGLDLITKVRPVNFTYNSKMKQLLGKNRSIDTRIYQGVIAQELQKIAPDMVREVIMNKERFLEVDPNKFTYALINAIQEQQKMINKQQDEINIQKTKIEHLEVQLKKQQKEIDAIKALIKKS